LKAISRSSLQKCERWRNEKLLEEINTERLIADCVRRKMKTIKTVYSQELKNITKSKKKSGAGTNDLCKPQLVWFDIHKWFLWNSVSYEANCFIIVGVIDAPS
jgi:DNA-binding ferritin-like protein